MGSSFGRIFRVSTFGESHGGAVGVILDGCPPNLKIDIEYLQHELNRRRPGQSNITTPRNEDDRIEILSGLKAGSHQQKIWWFLFGRLLLIKFQAPQNYFL